MHRCAAKFFLSFSTEVSKIFNISFVLFLYIIINDFETIKQWLKKTAELNWSFFLSQTKCSELKYRQCLIYECMHSNFVIDSEWIPLIGIIIIMSDANGFQHNRNPNTHQMVMLGDDGVSNSHQQSHMLRTRNRHITIVSYSSCHKECSYRTSHYVTSVR